MWKHKAVLHVALLNPDAWGVQAFYVFRTCKLRGKIKHLDEIRSKSSRHSKCASVTGTWNAHFCYSTCVFWPSLRFPKRHSKFQSVTIYTINMYTRSLVAPQKEWIQQCHHDDSWLFVKKERKTPGATGAPGWSHLRHFGLHHLGLRDRLVTSSKALVPTSVALVPSSVLVPTSMALVTRSAALVNTSFKCASNQGTLCLL